MPDVSSVAPERARLWVALDVHKLSIVAAVLPPAGGTPEVCADRDDRAAIRRFIDRLGGPEGLAVCYEAGPGGYDLWRLLTRIGVACDVVAPSLVPVRAGDRVKTDRRDAKKLVGLYRAGELRFVQPPDAGDRRAAGSAALPRRSALRADGGPPPGRQAAAAPRPDLPRGQDGVDASCTARGSRASASTTRSPSAALEQMLVHLDGLDRQLDALDAQPGADRRAASAWAGQVAAAARFRGISTRTALGLIAEIGDFRRFAHPRELALWLGITPSEYSSGDQQHRGHITKTGNRHARRLLVEAAWHYRHRPAAPDARPAARRARLARPDPPAPPPPPPHRARQALAPSPTSPSPASSSASSGPR